jgi:hypothetical protein
VRTKDGGKTWNFVSFVTPEPEGNDHAIMPSTVRLSPATLLTAVRYRNWIEAYQTGGGGSWDLGYPRTVQRADGKIVTVYYFNNAADQERYIGATIWDPGR